MKDILKVQTIALKEIHRHFTKKGFFQLMPVILSTETDPLAHVTQDGSIEYLGQRLHLTKSMILHKMFIVRELEKIYIVSPNVRFELAEHGRSGRHLIEFSQVDYEVKDASLQDIIHLTEELFIDIFKKVGEECTAELRAMRRKLPELKRPFPVYDSEELKKKYGKDWERITSLKEEQPFWVLNHYREFYDREDGSGKHINYDLVYPEGYGEALSGGEREHKYETIVRKMKERGSDLKAYPAFLEFARKGLIGSSAGAGFGVERLVRYLCGKKHIKDVAPFPRIPGEKIIF